MRRGGRSGTLAHSALFSTAMRVAAQRSSPDKLRLKWTTTTTTDGVGLLSTVRKPSRGRLRSSRCLEIFPRQSAVSSCARSAISGTTLMRVEALFADAWRQCWPKPK